MLSIAEKPMRQEDQWTPPVVNEANETRIRAGVTGHGVRTVLVASVAIVVVAFVILYFWR